MPGHSVYQPIGVSLSRHRAGSPNVHHPGKVDSITGSAVDAVFLKPASNALCIRKVTLCHSSNGHCHFSRGRSVQILKPLRIGGAAVWSEIFTNVKHCQIVTYKLLIFQGGSSGERSRSTAARRLLESIDLINSLVVGISGGETLSARKPSSSSVGMTSSRPASSRVTETLRVRHEFLTYSIAAGEYLLIQLTTARVRRRSTHASSRD